MGERVVDIADLKRKNSIKKTVVTVISVLVLIALAVFAFIRSDLRFLFKDEPEEIMMSQNSVSSYPTSSATYVLNEKYKSGVVVCSDGVVYALDERLDRIWKKEINAASPFMEVSGDYVLIADNGGRNYYLIKDGKTVVENQSDRVITGAYVNDDGRYILVCEDSPYLGSLTLYSNKDEVLYEWHSGDAYILDAVYIPQSKMIAASVLEVGEEVRSKVMFFDIYASDPVATYSYDGEVCVNIFSGGSSVYALCDNRVYGYELTGAEKFSYDYSGRTLEKCEFDMSGRLILALASSGKTDVVILDSKGREKGEIRVSESINYISVDSGKLAVNGGGGVYIYNLSGKHLYKVITDRDVADVCLFDGASRFFGVSSVSFDTVKIQ